MIDLLKNKKIYIYARTKNVIDIILSDMKKSKFDAVFVIGGHEGWGKSFMARGLARYCADQLGSSFGPKDIYFNVDDYVDGSMNGGKYKINVLDEARKVLNKKRAMSRDNVKFTDYISECRNRQQVHIICCPSYSDLDRYIVFWRMNVLFNIDKYHEDKGEGVSYIGGRYNPIHGKYRVFTDKSAIIRCYDLGYNHLPSRYESRDKWTSVDVFNSDELSDYDDIKHKAMLEKYGPKANSNRMTEKVERAVDALRNRAGFSSQEIAEIMEYNRDHVNKLLRNFRMRQYA